MLEWMKNRGSTARGQAIAHADATTLRWSNKAGKYQHLYEYLENRYATTVVLTFGQIEDLLGFTLPDAARHDRDWWTAAAAGPADASWSDAWTLASRTARANLLAQTVVFERAS